MLRTPSATIVISPSTSASGRPRPSASPTWRLRLRGLVQVTTMSPIPASPRKLSGFPPRASPKPGQLGQAPGDERGPGVVADAEPLGDAGGQRHHVLHHAGDLAADDVGVGVDAEGVGHEQPLDHRRRARRRPWPRPRPWACPPPPRWRCWGRSARRSGPSACPGRTSAATSVMRLSDPCSSPLARLSTRASGGTNGAASRQHRPEAVGRDGQGDDVGPVEGLVRDRPWPAPAPSGRPGR